MTTPAVYVITWVQRAESLETSLLTFSTLRVGFPTAEVTVIDNDSDPAFRPIIRQCATDCGAEYVQLEEHPHHELIKTIITSHDGPVVLADPDLVFWENIEGWQLPAGKLAGGRLIPRFACPFTRCITAPRLHTSLLVVPSPAALCAAIAEVQHAYFAFDPFHPAMLRIDGAWHYFDTGAGLYGALQERLHAFTERQLDSYDHLFLGTHLSRHIAVDSRDADDRRFLATHEAAKRGDLTALRGAWRWQQDFLTRLAPAEAAE